MKLYIRLILILLTISGFGSAFAQDASIVVNNSKEFPGKVLNIKWVDDDILFDEGVMLYRREDRIPFWTPIVDKPIMKGDYNVPDSAFRADTSLADYIELAKDIKSTDLQGMAKAFFLLEMVYNNEFAKYIGVQYDDYDVEPGKTYRYMIKRKKGDIEILVAVSEPVTVSPFKPEAPPKEVRAEGGNKKVHLWWKVENDRFHSINVYRSTSENQIPEKVNDDPVVLASRKGPDGKVGYPDVYYTDHKVKNDENYIYRLAGIDFFGHETGLSEPVLAQPINKTPPPAPKYLDCKVDLFNIELEWQPPVQNRVKGLHIYRSASIYGEFERITTEPLSPLAVRYSDKVNEPGHYYYYVSSVNKHGTEGKSNLTMGHVMDVFPPDAPKNLTAVSDSGQITLQWNSVEDKYFKGYRLYRTINLDNEQFYVLMNAEPIKDTFYIDDLPFNARNKFYYRVVALDTALNMSDYSNPASAVLPDVAPPDVPFIKEVKNLNDKGLDVIWLKNLEVDLMGYNLFRERTLVDSTVETKKINTQFIPADRKSWSDLTVEKGIEYKYYLQAIDSVGNKSGYSNKYPAIIEPPRQTGKVELKNINVKYIENKNEVKINWQIPSEVAGKGVVIFRSDTTGAPMMPVSGLIREKEFSEVPPKDRTEITYMLVTYSTTGTKWESGKYKVLITNKNK